MRARLIRRGEKHSAVSNQQSDQDESRAIAAREDSSLELVSPFNGSADG
jgi:hypothetical protein